MSARSVPTKPSETSHGELESAIQSLDARLRPIANRPVDLAGPDWIARAKTMDPWVETGLGREEAQALLNRVTERYGAASAEEREAIRGLFERYQSFAWAVQWL